MVLHYGNDLLVINKNLILSILLNYDNIHINCIQMRAIRYSVTRCTFWGFNSASSTHTEGANSKENMQSGEHLSLHPL